MVFTGLPSEKMIMVGTDDIPYRSAVSGLSSMLTLATAIWLANSGQVYRGEAPAGKLRDIGLGSDYAQARLRNRLLRDI